MKIIHIFNRQPKINDPIVVTFTGGMGAQIISAAIYFYFKDKGRSVYADLSYFNKAAQVARVGNKGEVSHWPWQLNAFGLSMDSFVTLPSFNKKSVNLIEDGPEKSRLAMEALRNSAVQERFAINCSCLREFQLDSINYLCIHVRRGDYVNVASHLVSDNEFFRIAQQFKGLTPHLVVVSDSPIPSDFRAKISDGFESANFLDNIDALTTHCVMRSARILVCSNSQFSLIAALLNKNGLIVLPKQWFGPGNEALEAPIHAACNFQLLN